MENQFEQTLLLLIEGWKALEIQQCGMVRHHPEGGGRFCQRKGWSFHFYHYHGSLEVDGEVFEFSPGAVSLVPPGRSVLWRFPRVALHHYLHFSVAGGSRSPSGLILGRPAAGIPLREELDFVVGHAASHPTAAALRFHDLLWRIALSARSSPAPAPPSSTLQIALSLIRNEMDRGIRVGEIARQCGVSRGHLNRLFQSNFGCSTQAYLQTQRIELIRKLLTQSEEPIVAIAAQAGFEDLQAFNKFVRRHLDASPRKLRHQ